MELTIEQQRELDVIRGRPRLIDPRIRATYVLIPEDEFQSLEEEREERIIHEAARRNAAGRMDDTP
jgi:hypothetical protein